MATTYEIKQFKNSLDKNLAKALNIYSQNIEPILRTNTNEILYWLDNYNNQFQDKFHLLGFYVNNELIGFAQIAFFIDEKLVFVDYIVIDKGHRKNNTFYEFVESIRGFIDDQNMMYDYIVGEVGYVNENKEPTDNTRSLIRLLKMSGFGVVKTSYYQPMLGKNNFESELMSVLMIYTASDAKKIKRETFQLIIETIYYKHYKRWFDRFMNEKEQSIYNDRLNKLFANILNETKKKEYIEINGYAHLYSISTKTPNTNRYYRLAKFLALLLIFIVLAIALGTIVIFLKRNYLLDEKELTFICTGAFILLFIIIRIFLNKEDRLIDIIEKVIKINK